jgi:hypothetical protein
VDILLAAYNLSNKNSQILVEHPFYLPENEDLIPLLPMSLWDSKLPSIGRLIGTSRLAKSDVPQEVIDDYLKSELKYKALRDRGASRRYC